MGFHYIHGGHIVAMEIDAPWLACNIYTKEKRALIHSHPSIDRCTILKS